MTKKEDYSLKKDYIKLAKLIKKQDVGIINSPKIYMDKEEFISDLCEMLKEDNSNFNKETFKKACSNIRIF